MSSVWGQADMDSASAQSQGENTPQELAVLLGGRDPCGASILSVAPPVAQRRPLWLGPWVSCPELVRCCVMSGTSWPPPACRELGVSGQSAREKLSLWVWYPVRSTGVVLRPSWSPERGCWSHLAPACLPSGAGQAAVASGPLLAPCCGESGCW